MTLPEEQHPTERTHAGAVLKELTLMERAHTCQEVCEGLYPTAGEGPHNGAREQHEEEAETEMESYDLTAMPISQPPQEEQLKWSEVKLYLTRRDEGGFGFIFLLCYCIIKCQTK